MTDLFDGLVDQDEAAMLQAGAAELDEVLAMAQGATASVDTAGSIAISLPAVGTPNGLTVAEQQQLEQYTNAMVSPVVDPPALPPSDAKQLAKELRQQTSAVRLQRSKWGTTRRLDSTQVQKAAESFSADARYLGASKKLINRRNQKYAACVHVISDATNYWKSVTIPYPEDGVRLIRKERIEQFNSKMVGFAAELAAAAAALEGNFDEIVTAAKEHLGELFREEDYPLAGVAALFAIEWDYPSVEPAQFLLQVSPALYEQQQQRIQARFEQAIQLAEERFTEKFAELVQHLADRLAFGEDGKPKVFATSTVDNLKEFFERFRALNTGSNPTLDLLVNQAQELVGGTDVSTLRTDITKRKAVKDSLAEITAKLDAMLVAKPARAFDFTDGGTLPELGGQCRQVLPLPAV